MVSVIFVVVSTVAMVINTLPDLAGPLDEKASSFFSIIVLLFFFGGVGLLLFIMAMVINMLSDLYKRREVVFFRFVVVSTVPNNTF